MNDTPPLALARPTLMIEIALPDGNKILPVNVARELCAQLTGAIAQLDAAKEPPPPSVPDSQDDETATAETQSQSQ